MPFYRRLRITSSDCEPRDQARFHRGHRRRFAYLYLHTIIASGRIFLGLAKAPCARTFKILLSIILIYASMLIRRRMYILIRGLSCLPATTSTAPTGTGKHQKTPEGKREARLNVLNSPPERGGSGSPSSEVLNWVPNEACKMFSPSARSTGK